MKSTEKERLINSDILSIENRVRHAFNQGYDLGYKEGIEKSEKQPKTGHWITQWNPAHQKEYYYCPECREEYSYDGETGIKMNDYNYCPNCGARMVEPQERSEE